MHLGSGSLASWSEAIYAVAARDIVATGDWLSPTRSTLWLHDPPLAVWATAFSFKLFGVTEFSARLFSALCGVACVVFTYTLGVRLIGRWAGLLGALVLLSSVHFFRFARFGMADVPYALFFSLALYAFWQGREKSSAYLWSGLWIGLALLTKSFNALLIPLLCWLYAFLAGERETLKKKEYWAGLALALAIAAPWHVWLASVSPQGLARLFEINYPEPRPPGGLAGEAYFYVRTMVNKFHPWILVGIVSAPLCLINAIREREKETIFLSTWIFFSLAILTLLPQKSALAVLPIYPALSLTVGMVLARVLVDVNGLVVRAGFVALMALHVPYSHIFTHDYSPGVKALTPYIRQAVSQGNVLYLYNFHEAPAVAFYADRRAVYLDDLESLMLAAGKDTFFVCLVRDTDVIAVAPLVGPLKIKARRSSAGLKLLFA